MRRQPLPEIPDNAYGVPEWVADPDLVMLYEVLVERLRRESEGIPMHTVTWMLMERIATNYVILRFKERQHIDGRPSGFEHGTAQKEFNTFFLGMLAEFHKQVARYAPKGGEDSGKVIDQVKGALSRALEGLDSETASVFRERLTVAFAEAGL